VQDIRGHEYPLAQHRGQVPLVVNTASHCLLTKQYDGLQQLFRTYHNRGFVVLGFPSPDFKNQEFGRNEQIAEFCQRYNVSFPLLSKVHVRGPQQHALWQYLTNAQQNGHSSNVPKWNFQKYLLDKQGHLVDVFMPHTSPTASRLRQRIEFLLRQP
jgi:glutathione peroxidase